MRPFPRCSDDREQWVSPQTHAGFRRGVQAGVSAGQPMKVHSLYGSKRDRIAVNCPPLEAHALSAISDRFRGLDQSEAFCTSRHVPEPGSLGLDGVNHVAARDNVIGFVTVTFDQGRERVHD